MVSSAVDSSQASLLSPVIEIGLNLKLQAYFVLLL